MKSLMAYTLATNLVLRFLETESKCDVLSAIMFIINFSVSSFITVQKLHRGQRLCLSQYLLLHPHDLVNFSIHSKTTKKKKHMHEVLRQPEVKSCLTLRPKHVHSPDPLKYD